MPTYVYRREDGTVFEVFQRISDAPLTVDPESGRPVQRVISGGAGLQFKGSGFYLTDYARAGSKGGSKEEGGSESSPSTAKSEGSPKSDSPKTDSGKTGSGSSSKGASASSSGG